jgi:hypothetical protein
MDTLTSHTELADGPRDPEPSHTLHEALGGHEQPQARSRGFLRRGWRKTSWAMIAWGILVAVGCLVALSSGGHALSECHAIGGIVSAACEEAVDNKIESKLQHLMTIGGFGFLILGFVWYATKPKD